MEEYLQHGVAAGLISPSLAGWLFEKNNNYDASIIFTLSISIVASTDYLEYEI